MRMYVKYVYTNVSMYVCMCVFVCVLNVCMHNYVFVCMYVCNYKLCRYVAIYESYDTCKTDIRCSYTIVW